MRKTYAEIDLGAIGHNAAQFIDLIAPSELCAVVKADAYGHGDVPVAMAALDAGATRLAVALTEEGVRLREAGIDSPILVLSEPDSTSVDDIVEWRLTPSVYSLEVVEALRSTSADIAVHVKIDTGMHRVGAAGDAAKEVIAAVERSPRLNLEGLFTHFPVADEDPEFTMTQIQEFDAVVAGVDAPIVHMANTAGSVLFPDSRRSFCRVGLGLYGLHPCDETRPLIELRPAMRVVSHVAHTQRLPAGARPSYGRVRPLPDDSNVATVPIGYADGYSRLMTDRGEVLIGGQRRPLAGMVTMDQAMVDVGDLDVARGDEVVLLGRQGDDEVTADEIAAALGTITHEVVCKIGPRVPRRYSR